jgi:hypothetical protein
VGYFRFSVRLLQIEFPDHGSKYVVMRDVAHEVERQFADGVIIVGEMWMAAADPSRPFMRAAEASDRIEVLGETLIRKEGVPVQLSAKLSREANRVILGETQISKDGEHFMFAPIYEVWGRPIPDGWQH